MNNYIKNLLSTRGWADVEDIILKGIEDMKNDDIDESLDGDNYKTVSLANKKASEKMQSILNKIKIAGGGDIKNKISYK